ncbi:hypothetical protein TRVL_02563 [Trypanosoma vivax]|nr:hypothetical protein TRVL_02563 [Trypanosoma vivax]
MAAAAVVGSNTVPALAVTDAIGLARGIASLGKSAETEAQTLEAEARKMEALLGTLVRNAGARGREVQRNGEPSDVCLERKTRLAACERLGELHAADNAPHNETARGEWERTWELEEAAERACSALEGVAIAKQNYALAKQEAHKAELGDKLLTSNNDSATKDVGWIANSAHQTALSSTNSGKLCLGATPAWLCKAGTFHTGNPCAATDADGSFSSSSQKRHTCKKITPTSTASLNTKGALVKNYDVLLATITPVRTPTISPVTYEHEVTATINMFRRLIRNIANTPTSNKVFGIGGATDTGTAALGSGNYGFSAYTDNTARGNKDTLWMAHQHAAAQALTQACTLYETGFSELCSCSQLV